MFIPVYMHCRLWKNNGRSLLAEPDILGVPLSKSLDNHKIPRAERVAFVQRNRGVNILDEG